MKNHKIRIFTLGAAGILALIFIASVVELLFSVCSGVGNRPIVYNTSLPVFSGIIVSESGLNIISILKFLVIEIIAICSPVIGFELSGDEYKSASLCLMPAVLWGIMTFTSFKLASVNDEIVVFLLSAFLHTVVSIVMYLRHLYRVIWNDENYCDDDYEEYEC